MQPFVRRTVSRVSRSHPTGDDTTAMVRADSGQLARKAGIGAGCDDPFGSSGAAALRIRTCRWAPQPGARSSSRIWLPLRVHRIARRAEGRRGGPDLVQSIRQRLFVTTAERVRPAVTFGRVEPAGWPTGPHHAVGTGLTMRGRRLQSTVPPGAQQRRRYRVGPNRERAESTARP
jgi:hypothetical protein